LKAAQTDQVKEFAALKGSIAVAIQGAEADKIMDQAASMFGWLLYDAGVTKVDPSTLGIKRL